MPVENRSARNADVGTVLFVSIERSLVELAERVLDRLDDAGLRSVVVAEVVPTPSPSPPAAGHVAASLVPMTDAIKRVRGDRVVATVDRERLAVAGFPLVIPVELARRWAHTTTSQSFESPPGPITAAALLSELVNVEPDLRVVGLEPSS